MSDATMPETAPAETARQPDFEFRDPARLTKVVSALLIVGAAASGGEALLKGAEYVILASHRPFDEPAWIGIQALLNLLQLVLLVVTTIAFLMWVYRANWNAHALGAVDMRFRPGWAVGWYFIPLANLWMPFRVMSEIWRVSANPGDWQNTPRSSVLGWWWALYLLHSGFNGAAYSDETGSVTQLMTDAVFAALASLLGVALNLVAWRMIRKIAANQLFQANVAQVF